MGFQLSSGLPPHTDKILVLLRAEGPCSKESALGFATGQKSILGHGVKIKHTKSKCSLSREPSPVRPGGPEL